MARYSRYFMVTVVFGQGIDFFFFCRDEEKNRTFKKKTRFFIHIKNDE